MFREEAPLVADVKPELPEKFKSLEDCKSIYLFGNPGSGKTFLMDMFYDSLPLENKVRLHYNEFMLEIHE